MALQARIAKIVATIGENVEGVVAESDGRGVESFIPLAGQLSISGIIFGIFCTCGILWFNTGGWSCIYMFY
jgi:hypothetical protein